LAKVELVMDMVSSQSTFTGWLIAEAVC